MAGVGGYRLGFLARALSWAGMALGIVLATRFLPAILERFESGAPTGTLMIAIGILLGGAFLGQALGLVIGSHAHLALPIGGRPLDRTAGAVSGVLGVLIGVWLLMPALGAVPGGIASQARNSTSSAGSTTSHPGRPTRCRHYAARGRAGVPRRVLGPRIIAGRGSAAGRQRPDPGHARRRRASTVLVEGRRAVGSRRAAASSPGPGSSSPTPMWWRARTRPRWCSQDGRRLGATVVHFDPDRDLAVLEVRGLDLPPLVIGDAEPGDIGAVLGHPGGGPLEVSPFQVSDEVEAVGRDLYDSKETRRQVLILASDLAPGDSGAALVDPQGKVVGVAFAIAPTASAPPTRSTHPDRGRAVGAPPGGHGHWVLVTGLPSSEGRRLRRPARRRAPKVCSLFAAQVTSSGDGG